jgi:Mg/Co/Ni transporter MgtE
METPIIDAGFIKQIKQLIANELLDDLRGQLAHIYAQDVADLLDKLDTNEHVKLCYALMQKRQ